MQCFAFAHIFLGVLGIPDQRIDYSYFPLPSPMCHESSYQQCQQTCNTSRRSLQYDSDVYDGLCLNRRGSPRVWTLRKVLTVRVATYPPYENTAIHFRLSPHTPCQAAVASCPDRPGYFQQCDTRASGNESAESDKCI